MKGERGTVCSGVAIHWPDDPRRIASVMRTGRCPSFDVPRALKTPGGLVALVGRDGTVRLVFRIARIEEGVRITAPNGKRYPRGCVLVARKGSARAPGSHDPKVLSVNRNALGAFAYFDVSTFDRVVFELGKGDGPADTAKDRVPGSSPPRHYPLLSNNVGKTLSQPERRLIQDYTAWIGDVKMFVHHPLKESGLFTDLFIPRLWALVEAKAEVSRRTLREAIGQLFDYQRHYDRSPRLAVLLPHRPDRDIMRLFDKKRIGVIWRSRGSSFHDSMDGVFTKHLRAAAR